MNEIGLLIDFFQLCKFGQEKSTFLGHHIVNIIVAHFWLFYCQNVFMKSKTLKAIFLGCLWYKFWRESSLKSTPGLAITGQL